MNQNQKEVKKRDVMEFDDFAKAYETAKKVIMTKKGQNADPGAHKIEGEGLYSRNDANPYKAFGIPHDEKTANASDFANANHVDVEDKNHDGKDPIGKEKLNQPVGVADKKVTKEVDKMSNILEEPKIEKAKKQ